MRLRKLLIAGSAVAAAAAFALVPVAQASTPGGNVGSVTVTGGPGFSGALKAGTSVTMNVFGTPTKLTCSSGNIAGTATAGTPAPNPVLRFTAMNLTCVSINPSQTLTMSIPNTGCATWSPQAGALVHDGLTDRGPKGNKFEEVLGALTLSATGSPLCVVTVTAGPCVITVAGTVTSNFDEWKNYPATPVIQNLNLKGTGLTVRTVHPLCFGIASVGTPLTMNSVNFNITGATVDIRDTP